MTKTRRPGQGPGRPSSRDAMLDAAEAIVVAHGAVRLTLDAVAREAGVSKGGVMYHFPSKNALLEALVSRAVERSHAAREAQADKLPDAPARALHAYVRASINDPLHNDRVSGALLSVVASDPKLMAPVRDFFRKRLPAISEGVPFERAALVHLATEGLWLMELFRVSPFTRAQRARIKDLLTRLATGGGQVP
ncbi:TetR/AcrR family transcriptional regulator [Solimonas soli]|uniref:TetR/AcrR family transcriptional regulator n=1 Tax=Solimonas soli TaxID=413479 RepID=UPI000489C447|nr:TetR/AcrR family transcriptional regulator [Solimonas soli]